MKILKIVGLFVVLAGIVFASHFASASELMSIIYTLNPQTASVASDHTITFKTPSAISSGTITLYLRNVVTSMGSTPINFADIDLSHGASLASQTHYTLATSAAAGGVWGVEVNTANKTIQFTYPTGGATPIATQEFVVIKIGKNADGGTLSAGSNNKQMINSASTTTRTFTVVAQPTPGVAPHVGMGYARGGALGYGTSTVEAPVVVVPVPTNTGGTPAPAAMPAPAPAAAPVATAPASVPSTQTTSTITTPSSSAPVAPSIPASTTQTPQPLPAQTQPPAQQTPLPTPELAVTLSSKVIGLLVEFFCSASGGTSPYVSYVWSFGDDTTGIGASATHVYKIAGNYTATCSVKDTTNKSAIGSTPVQVSEALVVSLKENTSELKTVLTCIASGGKAEYAYTIDFGDGTTSTGMTGEHTYKTAGLYTAQCSVVDALGKISRATKAIPIVEPLSLNAGVRLSADVGVELTIAGFTQNDKGLDVYGVCNARGGVGPYSYVWGFGDGDSSTLASVVHTYRDVGEKTAQCTVSDARGKSVASKLFTISVKPGLKVMISAKPSESATGIVVSAPVSLMCTASGGSLPYSYKWKITDESGKVIQNDTDFSPQSSLNYMFVVSGTYTASCDVRDGDTREQNSLISIGVANVEIAKELNKSVETLNNEIDTAMSEATVKIVSETPITPTVKVSQSPSAASSSEAIQPTVQTAPSLPLPSTPLPPPQSTLFTSSSGGASTAIAEAVPIEAPPPGASEATPNIVQNTINMTISTSAPVTGALCEQVGIKNADNATEMFVWFCPQESARPTSLLTRIKLAAQNVWYGLKKLALGGDQYTTASAQVKKSAIQQSKGVTLTISQSLVSELSSSIEKQLGQDSKQSLASKVRRANSQQLARLQSAIKMVVQSGLQKIEAYSFDGVRSGDSTLIEDFSTSLVVKKSLAGRVIEIIVPEDFSPEKAVEIVMKNDTFIGSDVRDRSKNQVDVIQKEFNKLAQKAYNEGLSVLRKRYAKEVALSPDVDDALQKAVRQRLQDEKVQKQLIELARGTVVQQVAVSASKSAAQDEEPVIPGQQPTLSQLLRTPNSVTIAPLNQGQAEKLLKQNLILTDFPGAKPIPNQIKEVGILDANGMGLVRLPSPMKLTMCWDESVLNALNISVDPIDPSKTMCIGHFNPSTGTGKCEQAKFDMASRCATTQVDSVSIFALFGRAGAHVAEASSVESKPRVNVNVVPSVRLRMVESLIDSEDLGIHQSEEAISPSDLGGTIYIAPSTQLSLCVSPNAFLKKVKDINVTIGSKTHSLRYEQSRECFSGSFQTPSDRGQNKVQMRIVYIDDQVQIITLNTIVTNKLQAIILNQIALPVNEVGKIVAAISEQVQQTVETTQPALQTTAIATAPIIAIANPAVLSNTINWYHYLSHLFSWLFSLLGFRKRRKPWGVVYDAAAKQPIDLAVVRLFDKKTNKLIETQVTDKQGRFSFLTALGTYSISIAKPPYTFPSEIIKGSNDGEYANIYRQQDIVVNSSTQIINMSIPLDPPSRDRVSGLTAVQQINQFFKKHASGSLVAGFIISAALAFYTPGTVNSALFVLNGAYVFFQLVVMGFTEKPWGTVFSATTLEPIPLAAISIIDAKENKVLRTRLTDYYGRFNFLTPPGEYSVIVSKDTYQFPAPQTIAIKKYHHLYRGGTVRVRKERGYVAINVPLVPKSP